MSLALGPHKGKLTYLYAGVNSSPASILKGQNEHFRTLAIEQSKARQSSGGKAASVRLAELGRASMFEHVDADAYQRLLRVATGGVGAAASAMGQQPELAVFQADGEKITIKGVLELPREAEDLDVIQTGEESWQVAFCHKFQLFVVNIGKDVDGSEPEEIWVTPEDESPRPTFRSIRYLSKDFIMAAVNLPNRSGVVLQGFRLPSVSPTGQKRPARLAVTARIPRKISATAMSVTNLNTPTAPGVSLGDTQFLVALAGNDASISVYSVEHFASASIDLIRKLHPLTTLTDVHQGGSVTGLAFSTFVTPKTQIRAQFVKLASISLQKTVAVHSIPLQKHVEKPPRSAKGPPPPRQVRYITAMKPQAESSRPLLITLGIFVLVMAVIGQTIMELYSSSHQPVLGVQRFFPSWHGTLRDPAHMGINNDNADAPPPAQFLADDFLSKLSGGRTYGPGETLVLWHGEAEPGSEAIAAGGDKEAPPSEATTDARRLQLDVHDVKVHGPGKSWDELAEEQKEAWRKKLGEAGAWTQGMGENVFRGILFGELGGVVRQAVGG